MAFVRLREQSQHIEMRIGILISDAGGHDRIANDQSSWVRTPNGADDKDGMALPTSREETFAYGSPTERTAAIHQHAWVMKTGIVRVSEVIASRADTASVHYTSPRPEGVRPAQLPRLAGHLGQMDAALQTRAHLTHSGPRSGVVRDSIRFDGFGSCRARIAAALAKADTPLIDERALTRLFNNELTQTLHLGAAIQNVAFDKADVVLRALPMYHLAPVGWSIAELLATALLELGSLSPDLLEWSVVEYVEAGSFGLAPEVVSLFMEVHRILLSEDNSRHPWAEVRPVGHEDAVRKGLRRLADRRRQSTPSFEKVDASPEAAREIAAQWERVWPKGLVGTADASEDLRRSA